MMFRLLPVLLIAFGLQPVLPAAQSRPTPEALAVALQKRYQGIRDFAASFVHTYRGGVLRTQTTEAMSAAPGRMILDLRETTFLDSSALHFAVETHEWAMSTGTRFAIVPGPAVVRRTFEVAGLSEQLPFVDVPRAA